MTKTTEGIVSNGEERNQRYSIDLVMQPHILMYMADATRQNEKVIDSVVADVDKTQDDTHTHTTNIMEDDSTHTTIPQETASLRFLK